jgi:hypothetical protein
MMLIDISPFFFPSLSLGRLRLFGLMHKPPLAPMVYRGWPVDWAPSFAVGGYYLCVYRFQSYYAITLAFITTGFQPLLVRQAFRLSLDGTMGLSWQLRPRSLACASPIASL